MVKIEEGSGCVFCDVGLPREKVLGQWLHYVERPNQEFVKCKREDSNVERMPMRVRLVQNKEGKTS